MYVISILLVACAVGHSSNLASQFPQAGGAGGGAIGYSGKAAATAASAAEPSHRASKSAKYDSDSESYYAPSGSGPSSVDSSVEDIQDGFLPPVVSAAETAALAKEHLEVFMRCMLLLHPHQALPQQGTALYAMLSDIGPQFRNRCVDRIKALQEHIHPQYRQNLVMSLCQEGFDVWTERKFHVFFQCAIKFLSQRDDCSPVITKVSSLMGRNTDIQDADMPNALTKIGFALPFCRNRTSMDVYLILSTVQESSKFPNSVNPLALFFSGLLAESFRDFMEKYQTNPDLEEAITAYQGDFNDMLVKSSYLRSLLRRVK